MKLPGHVFVFALHFLLDVRRKMSYADSLQTLVATNGAVVITGAASGIGRGLAVGLSKIASSWNSVGDGAKPAALNLILGDRDERGAKATALACVDAGMGCVSAVAVSCDVTSEADVDALINAAGKIEGNTVNGIPKIAALFNCAGVATGGEFLTDAKNTSWKKTLDINIDGTLLPTQRVLHAMMFHQSRNNATPSANAGGPIGPVIVNIASLAAFFSSPENIVYAVSKGAIVRFTQTLSPFFKQYGIRTHCVCPGYVDTPMVQSVAQEHRKSLQIPDDNKQWITVEQITKLMIHLALAETKRTGVIVSMPNFGGTMQATGYKLAPYPSKQQGGDGKAKSKL